MTTAAWRRGRGTDPRAVAKAAKLHYVADTEPGISRKRNGRGFIYLDPGGKPVRDEATLKRIKQLVIPPAWTDVWICPDPLGHIQVTARDARRRKQYRYHPRWTEATGESKYERMLLFGEHLPRIRARVRTDLALKGLPREKVLAAVVALLGSTFIRVGNEEYVQQNDSYGLTTLRDEHVQIRGSSIHFEFRGKSGKAHELDLQDSQLAKIVKASRDAPGRRLFRYYDEDGNNHAVTSADVNTYLKQISGQAFTAKDFRTWGGTLLAMAALSGMEPFETQKQLKSNLTQMYKSVAEQLGNTVAVCKKYYVHPAVIELYQSGNFHEWHAKRTSTGTEAKGELDPAEAAVMALLGEYHTAKNGSTASSKSFS